MLKGQRSPTLLIPLLGTRLLWNVKGHFFLWQHNSNSTQWLSCTTQKHLSYAYTNSKDMWKGWYARIRHSLCFCPSPLCQFPLWGAHLLPAGPTDTWLKACSKPNAFLRQISLSCPPTLSLALQCEIQKPSSLFTTWVSLLSHQLLRIYFYLRNKQKSSLSFLRKAFYSFIIHIVLK